MSDDVETLKLACAQFVRYQKEICELLNEDTEADSIALHTNAVYGIKALKEQMPWWHTFETPPKPGERVMLWFPELGYPVTGWPEAYGYKAGGWKPTHWMPLPAAPDNSTEKSP